MLARAFHPAQPRGSLKARCAGMGAGEQGLRPPESEGLFILAIWMCEGRPLWTGQRGWAVLLAFDTGLEVGDNT
jgi:hypothetical protein